MGLGLFLLSSSLLVGIVVLGIFWVFSSSGDFLGAVTINLSVLEIFDDEEEDEDDRRRFLGSVWLLSCLGLGCFLFCGRLIGVGGKLGCFDGHFLIGLDFDLVTV